MKGRNAAEALGWALALGFLVALYLTGLIMIGNH